ncbi:MAG: hypothetical protein WED07_15845 [Candidatus Freyarchaeum deiterrae]
MARAGVVVSGVIAIFGVAFGALYGLDKMSGALTGLTLSNLLSNLFNPQTFVGLVILAASAVALVCSILLIVDRLAVVAALIVLIWGILLLFIFGGSPFAVIGGILLVIGGFIGLITSIAS